MGRKFQLTHSSGDVYGFTHEKPGVGSLLKQGGIPKKIRGTRRRKSFVSENVNVHLWGAVVPVVGLGLSGGLPAHVPEGANFLISNSPFSSSDRLHSAVWTHFLSIPITLFLTSLNRPRRKPNLCSNLSKLRTSGLLPGSRGPGAPVVGENVSAQNASALIAEEGAAPSSTESGIPTRRHAFGSRST